jgi:hypothetical protein
MRSALLDLARNLIAGLRLALGSRLSIRSFHVTLGALLALIAFNVAFDILLDWLRAGAHARFSYFGASEFALATAVFLLVSAIVTVALREPHLMLTIPTLSAAATPPVQLAALGYRMMMEHAAGQATSAAWIAWLALTAWQLFILARVLLVALANRPRRLWPRVATVVALLFGSAIGVQFLFGERSWWYAERSQHERTDYWAAVSEQALAKQPALLGEALAALQPQRAGVTDLYFVAFAPYAEEDVFRKDAELAASVVARRYDAAHRSVVLVNNPRTVLEKPLATVTNLRTALNAVGRSVDRDDDVLLLFLTSHGGRDHALATSFGPLRLDPLTPAALKAILDEARIRWRIVVVSACYSGGFIPALANDETIVLTAAAADRQSFGCGDASELTYFTDALFNRALREETSISKAFEKARALVAERERTERRSPPSNPQISIGAAIAAKLPALEARPHAKTSAACAAAHSC